MQMLTAPRAFIVMPDQSNGQECNARRNQQTYKTQACLVTLSLQEVDDDWGQCAVPSQCQ